MRIKIYLILLLLAACYLAAAPSTFSSFDYKYTNWGKSELAAKITLSSTTVRVKTGEGARFPQNGPFRVFVYSRACLNVSDCSKREGFILQLASGNTFSILSRATQSTDSPAEWNIKDRIEQVVSTQDFQDIIDEFNSFLTTSAGVQSFNGRAGYVVPTIDDYASFYSTTTHTHPYAPLTRLINNHDLSSDFTLTCGEIEGCGSGQVASVFGRTGSVIAQEGDYSAYYATPSSVSSQISNSAAAAGWTTPGNVSSQISSSAAAAGWTTPGNVSSQISSSAAAAGWTTPSNVSSQISASASAAGWTTPSNVSSQISNSVSALNLSGTYMLKAASSTNGLITKWSGTNGNQIVDGYSVATFIDNPGSQDKLTTEAAVRNAIAAGGYGTVSSVGLGLPIEFNVTGSPVTVSGTLTGSWTSQAQHYFFAAPSGAAGTPSFRAIAVSDIPQLNQNTSGTAAGLSSNISESQVTNLVSDLALKFAIAGGTLTGKMTTTTSSSGSAAINVPHGSAPASPLNGDIWTTTSGLYVQVNGSTIGPLGSGGAGGGDFSTNTSTAVDGEAVLFSGTTGKLGKRATGTGPAYLTSGRLASSATGTSCVYGFDATATWTCMTTLPAVNASLLTSLPDLSSYYSVTTHSHLLSSQTGTPVWASAYIGDLSTRYSGTTHTHLISAITDSIPASRITGTITGDIGGFTASRAIVSSAGGTLDVSATTATEIGYLNGVTSSVQTQLNGKQSTLTNPVTGTGTQYYIPYWTAAGTIGALAGLGTSGQALVSNGAGAPPTWQTVTSSGTPTMISSGTGTNKFVVEQLGTGITTTFTLPTTASRYVWSAPSTTGGFLYASPASGNTTSFSIVSSWDYVPGDLLNRFGFPIGSNPTVTSPGQVAIKSSTERIMWSDGTGTYYTTAYSSDPTGTAISVINNGVQTTVTATTTPSSCFMTNTAGTGFTFGACGTGGGAATYTTAHLNSNTTLTSGQFNGFQEFIADGGLFITIPSAASNYKSSILFTSATGTIVPTITDVLVSVSSSTIATFGTGSAGVIGSMGRYDFISYGSPTIYIYGPSALTGATNYGAPPNPPSGYTAYSGGTGTIALAPGTSSGATSYNAYWCASSCTPTSGSTKISSLTTPTHMHTGLTDGYEYTHAFTAQSSYGESTLTSGVAAVPAFYFSDVFTGNNGSAISSGTWSVVLGSPTIQSNKAQFAANSDQGTFIGATNIAYSAGMWVQAVFGGSCNNSNIYYQLGWQDATYAGTTDHGMIKLYKVGSAATMYQFNTSGTGADDGQFSTGETNPPPATTEFTVRAVLVDQTHLALYECAGRNCTPTQVGTNRATTGGYSIGSTLRPYLEVYIPNGTSGSCTVTLDNVTVSK